VKDASLKVPPSIQGTVITKKLFARAKKDKTAKTERKTALEKLDKDFDKRLSKIKRLLIDKLIGRP
jgi:DNA-directed RNA polymerase subunit beta